MYVTLVHVHVKPEHLAEFIEVTRANHEGSVLEPGNLRFDILQSVEDPTRFVAYEAYRDEASAKAHKETAHYLAWRDAVADWMVEPRVGVRYDGLFPAVPDAVKQRPTEGVDSAMSHRESAARSTLGGSMDVTMTHIHVQPDHVADFIESIRVNHEHSILEPGNLRFDILHSVDDPTRFVTYMAYRDEATTNAHRKTPHYLAWRDEVARWEVEPRVGVRYDGLFPAPPDSVR